MHIPTRLPPSDLYVIYSMSNSPYQQWQAELLDFSARTAGQPGEIVRLCSRDADYPALEVQPTATGTTFETASFAELDSSWLQVFSRWMKRTLALRPHGRFHFFCLNKPFAMKNLLEANPSLDGEARLLWLDPDMVFNRPWVPTAAEVGRGRVFGQRWWGFDRQWCMTHAGSGYRAAVPAEREAIMFPFCISVQDMRRISEEFCHLAGRLYLETRDWKSEMYALVLAMGAAGLKCRTGAAVGTCNNWPEGLPDDATAPISHYTQPMADRSGGILWDKRTYTDGTGSRPWQRPPNADRAATLTDRRTLRMIHRLIDHQEAQAQHPRQQQHGEPTPLAP